MRRLRDEIDSSDAALVRAARLLSLAAPLDASLFWNLQPVRGTCRVRALSFRMAALVALSLGSFVASAAVLPHLHTRYLAAFRGGQLADRAQQILSAPLR